MPVRSPPTGFTSIREVARELGVTLRAVRFYEAKGLVSPKRQMRNRLYTEGDVERLRLIMKLKSFGLSILEIKELITKPGTGPYGLSAEIYAELVERAETQKCAAETALAQLGEVDAHFRPQRKRPGLQAGQEDTLATGGAPA